MKLREIAHSRAGDKGNISNLSLIAYQMEDYPLLQEQVTAERVKAWFQEIVQGEVRRYELPKIGALNFVLVDALGGGVTRSLALDRHGKSLSSLLLEMEIEERLPRVVLQKKEENKCAQNHLSRLPMEPCAARLWPSEASASPVSRSPPAASYPLDGCARGQRVPSIAHATSHAVPRASTSGGQRRLSLPECLDP
jgi:hypothetical protein